MADVRFFRWDDIDRERVTDMLERKLITGDGIMLAHVFLKKGCVVPRHQHHNEQFTYILEGALRFTIGEEGAKEVVVRAGEVLHIPSNVWHEAEALEDQQAITRQMQLEAFDSVPYYPLGQSIQQSAIRSEVSDRVEGYTVFWGVRKNA